MKSLFVQAILATLIVSSLGRTSNVRETEFTLVNHWCGDATDFKGKQPGKLAAGKSEKVTIPSRWVGRIFNKTAKCGAKGESCTVRLSSTWGFTQSIRIKSTGCETATCRSKSCPCKQAYPVGVSEFRRSKA
ncbi:hypothetical protein K525DRAFT_246574 [Schizophyllum commune Loenen D]|nr:hypothetical protein K525DRAFT_246574 [Schizophyllum commune Loenen D]